jgi:hypothetical protein
MTAERAMAERVLAERGQDRATGGGPADAASAESSASPLPIAARIPDPQTTVIPPPPEPRQAREPEVRKAEVRQPEVRQAEVRQPEVRQPEVRYAEARRSSARETTGEPPLEEVEVTDLLLVMDLRDEVLVVDEHPRYHLSGCAYLAGAETFPLPIDEARSDGFTPCGSCSPDRHLAQRARQRK